MCVDNRLYRTIESMSEIHVFKKNIYCLPSHVSKQSGIQDIIFIFTQ